MGQEQSSGRRASSAAPSSADAYDKLVPAGEARVSLWEGVPPPILWLAQSQLKLLLTQYTSSLLQRPEQLAEMDDDDEEEEGEETRTAGARPRPPQVRSDARRGPLQPHEAALAAVALRDKAIGARLQKALDRLVPARMPEAAFWDNFFSHVDVIKVRLVTDFLTAQEAARTAAEAKHERWVQLFDAMEPEMRQDVRRAAERIAARQQPPQLSDLEHQLGLDAHRSARWVPESVDASLEYVEDGPHEVAKVLRAALVTRGQLADEPTHTPNRIAPGELPMWRSPDDVGSASRRPRTPRCPELALPTCPWPFLPLPSLDAVHELVVPRKLSFAGHKLQVAQRAHGPPHARSSSSADEAGRGQIEAAVDVTDAHVHGGVTRSADDAADGDGATVEEDFVYESGAPKRAQVPKGMEGGGSKAVAAAVSGVARAAGA